MARRKKAAGGVSFDLNLNIDGAKKSTVEAANKGLVETVYQAASIARRTTAVKDKSGKMRQSIVGGPSKFGAYLHIGFPGSFHEYGTKDRIAKSGGYPNQSGGPRGVLPVRPIIRPAVEQALNGLKGRLTNSV